MSNERRGPICNIKGDPGNDGKSNYELAVENGFTGNLTEWLESIKGEKGDIGSQGPKGDTGATGPKGDTGATGSQGPPGSSYDDSELRDLIDDKVDSSELADIPEIIVVVDEATAVATSQSNPDAIVFYPDP